jgi:ethanolaminephosphotransferase
VAPNLITLIGAVVHILGNLSVMVQKQGEPCWAPTVFLFGLCIIVYYIIDNVDGKQARRTSSSSPLGMCMDHGSDAFCVSFLAYGLSRVVLFDNNALFILTAQLGVVGTFWLSAWAQYHSNGVLLLGTTPHNIGKFNVVDDGIPLVSAMGFLSYFVGQHIWVESILGPLTAQHILVMFVWVTGTGRPSLMQPKQSRLCFSPTTTSRRISRGPSPI